MKPRKNEPSTRLTGRLTNQPTTSADGDTAGTTARHAAAATVAAACLAPCRDVDAEQAARSAQEDSTPTSRRAATMPSRGSASRWSRAVSSPAAVKQRRRARAGLSVSELNAEMTVETAIVRANCRKNCPVMPAMNARRHEHRARAPARWR